MMPHVSPRTIRSDLYSISALDPPPFPPRTSPCLLPVLSSLLQRLIARNERLAPLSPSPSPSNPRLSPEKFTTSFGLRRPPPISIQQYLQRIFKYANCSPSCFVVAYAYLDRMIQQQPRLRITALNVHRLLITSVMVAAKFLDDIYYDNAYYAEIGGITTKEMNKLEVEFLFLLDFRLQVTVSMFESYCSHLEREVALGGGYQIERTLRSICALDGGGAEDKSSGDQQNQQRMVAVRCSDGS